MCGRGGNICAENVSVLINVVKENYLLSLCLPPSLPLGLCANSFGRGLQESEDLCLRVASGMSALRELHSG